MLPLDLAPGVRLGRFLLERCLGSGGMGSVWAAEDDSAAGRVALKILHPRLAGQPEARLRLLREARATLLIEHPGIVPVREVVEIDGALVLCMELLTGETLRARFIARGTLGASEAAWLLAPVAATLAAAHAAGVVHRDLKPENVFLTRAPGTGELVRVLDFGVAKLLDIVPEDGPNVVTGLGALLGTIAYMAPEQVLQASAVDARADIWGLGVVLYEALAGFRPIEGTSRNDSLRRLLLDAVPPILTFAPETPVLLADLLARMLARNPDKRPGAAETAALLADFAST
jgi:serine/threonine-protein kinase